MAQIDDPTSFVEQDDHWELPLVGRAVTRCLIDHAFGLQLWDSQATFEIWMEGPFSLIRTDDGSELVLDPEKTSSLGPALQLFGEEIHSAKAFKDGRLEIQFPQGLLLRVAPNTRYEAWRLTGDGDQKIVSLPGGELALWG